MKTAFVSYKYIDELEPVALMLRNWFKIHDIDVVDGKRLNVSESLNEQLKKRIDDADILVSIRKDGESSTYVTEEAAYAAGAKKPVIIVSQGAFNESSLLNDQFYINLNRGFEAANDLSDAVVKILEREHLNLDAKKVKHSPKDEIDAEGWAPQVRKELKRISLLIDERNINAALRSSKQLYMAHPDCWRAAIAMSACLIITSHYDEAEQVLNTVVSEFSGLGRPVSYAYQNLAWLIFERDRGIDENMNSNLVKAYRKSIAAYPRLDVYIDLMMTYLDADMIHDAEAVIVDTMKEFPNIKTNLKELVDRQGADLVKLIAKSPLLNAIVFPKNDGGEK